MKLYLPLILLVICFGCSRQPENKVVHKSATNNFVASSNVKSSVLNHSTSKSGDPASTSSFDMGEVERLTIGFSEESELITKIKTGIPISSNELRDLVNAYNGKQEQLLNIMRDGYYWRENTAALYIDYLHMATGLATEVGPIFYKAELADAYAHYGSPENMEKLVSLAQNLEKPKLENYSKKHKFLKENDAFINLMRKATMGIKHKDPEAAAEMYLKAVDTENKSFLSPMINAAIMYRMADKTEKAIEILTELVNMPPEKKYIVPEVTVNGEPMPEFGKAIIILDNDRAVEKGKKKLEKYMRLLKEEELNKN